VTRFCVYEETMKAIHHNIRAFFVLGFMWLLIHIAGCSGSKTYVNLSDHNLHVQTAADSGSLFSSVRAAVDIHRVSAGCTTDYEGTVQLSRPQTAIGIPPNRWSRLVFVFASYSFWSNRSGTMMHETLVKPRVGYHYQAMVTYKDDIYNVVLRETPPNSSASREIEHRDLHTCPLK